VLFGYNATVATLMGVPANHESDFFVMTQKQYAALVEAGENSLITMVKALNDGILGHPVLAQVSCTR
jgi:hypothetical protein